MNLAIECCGECKREYPWTIVGLGEAIKGREEDFPTLALAVQNTVPATNPTIQWLVAGITAKNHCSIFRTPFSHRDKTPEEALNEHLLVIEQAFLFGKPSRTEDMKTADTVGGVYHYLGRLPRPGDTVSLRPLRDLTFRHNVGARDLDDLRSEWLSEVSLEVRPG